MGGRASVVIVVGLLAACRPEPSECLPPRFEARISVETVDQIDLLLMIDNSNSMAGEQALLGVELPRMVRILASGDANEDGVEDFEPVRSLHVGVVTSDMGAGPAVPPGEDPFMRTIAPAYERVITAHARGRLLDCGCGDVPYYAMYRPHVSEVTCVDWGGSLNGRQHVDVDVDLNGALPFEDARFDTVLLADVLEHIAEPHALIAEIARVLAPGGKLIAMVPFFYPVHEAPHDHYRYTRFALERMCERAGLKVTELAPYGGYPDVLLDVVNKGLESWPLACRAFLALSGWWSRSGLIERWRAQSRERFPLGYCLVASK